jgi:1,4-alpha-glucan branching enzyme
MALNQASENTIQANPASDQLAADGTGAFFSTIDDLLLTYSGIVQLDPWLEPFKDALKSRFAKAKKWIDTINQTEGGLDKFSRGFEKFGFTFADNGDITYREWVCFSLAT